MWQALFILSAAAFVALLIVARRRFQQLRLQLLETKRENDLIREHQEKAQLELSTREETLLNNISEGILFLDPQLLITGANDAIIGMFSLPASPKGKTLLEAFRLHQLVDLIKQVQISGEQRDVEVAVAAPNSDERIFEVSAAPLRRSGGDGFILTFHDISRLKQLEKMRKEFVANVSHELRTPLALIKGFAETLLDGAIHDAAAAPRFVTTIQRNADRLALIIDDLLTISSLESGNVVLEKQSLRLHPLVTRIAADLQGRPQARLTRIENLIPPGLVVCADLQRLQQVLTNLIDNAIKYGRDNGLVKVSAVITPDKDIQISVADNGPGIPANALDRIFERFYRVDKARSREQGGTGLGLSIVKHIVQVHGGRLWVESTLGQGSTFYFTLPDLHE